MDVITKINKSQNIWQILPLLNQTELEKAIVIASDSYYNDHIQLISDEVFDNLVERLRYINPQSKILTKIGAPIKGKKVKLPYWMGSQDKIKTNPELITKWKKTFKGPYVITSKLDGISCLLIIENNRIYLYTRGDGEYGQDISYLAKYVNLSINNLLKSPVKIAIRGELIMTKKKFKKYATTMSNARNMVGGIVNSKPSSINVKHANDVDFVAYELIEPSMIPIKQLEYLEKNNLNTVYYEIYDDINDKLLSDVLTSQKKNYEYEIDGIIIIDNKKYVKNIQGNPKYSFAYKGMTEIADVKVEDIIWKASKDGYLIPKIQFETTRLSQADLKYAAGFNARFIVDNQLGKGAIITVVRSGDVIPHILGVVKPAKKISFPNEDYEWDKNNVNIVLTDIDNNYEVIVSRITRFVSYLGVEHLSEGLIKRLVNEGYDTIPKIISLTVDDLLKLDGFKITLANKIYNNLQNALNKVDILSLMAASNIFGRGFGIRKLKKILEIYPSIVMQYTNKDHEVWYNNLVAIDGFDTITANQFLDALPEFQKFFKQFIKITPVKPYKSEVKQNGIFKNETIVFTGFRNADWQKYIESNGGRVTTTISSKSSLLVYNDGGENSEKYKKAKKLNIKTMSKSQFEKKYKL